MLFVLCCHTRRDAAPADLCSRSLSLSRPLSLYACGCVCVSVLLSGATSGFGVRDTSAGPNVRYVGVGFVRTRVLVRCFSFLVPRSSFAVRRSVAALSLIYFIWSVMPVFAVGSATSYRFL